MRRGFYSGLAVWLLILVRRLPERVGERFCVTLARIAYRIRPKERLLAEANMAQAFPTLGPVARHRLLQKSTEALGLNLYETLVLERRAAEEFQSVRDEGCLSALTDLRSEGKGVLILTGHIGCWELLGAFLAERLGGLAVVTGLVHNPPVARFLKRRRSQLGMIPLVREGNLRPLLKHLRDGGVAAVLLDQNTRVQNIDVPFFGKPAPTPIGFAKLALRYEVPVLPVAIARCQSGHVVTHLPPIRPVSRADAGGVLDFLLRCNAALETFIRRNPAEWVWFHQRWPTTARSTEQTRLPGVK
jgi:KDO2-lipid IV(A) lauroyltransferase